MEYHHQLVPADLLKNLLAVLPGDQDVYLVGGTVRDFLLRRTAHDIDLVFSGNPRWPAKKLADRLGGAFYKLDDERRTYRIIYQPEQGRSYSIDIAGFRGPDLEADLSARDFSINAMAVDIRNLHSIIDPLGGAKDLRAKILRACSPQSITDDPIRLVRGVRLAFGFDLHIEDQTRNWLREAVPLLHRVSAERKRDELFRILSGPKPAAAIRTLDWLGCLPELLPELTTLQGVPQSPPHIQDVWNHTLSVLENLWTLLALMSADKDPNLHGNIYMGMMSLRLGRYRSQVQEHFAQSLNPNRSLTALLSLAALYHDIAKPATKSVDEKGRIRNFGHDEIGAEILYQRAQALQLSNAECERLRTIVRHHMRIHLIVQTGQPPTRRAIYRFFRDTGSAGIDICFHILADTLGTYGPNLTPEKWQAYLDVCRVLMENWWEKPAEIVKPKGVINGDELQSILGLKPGPFLGELIAAIREAQACGEIQDKEGAIRFAKEWLDGKDHPPKPTEGFD